MSENNQSIDVTTLQEVERLLAANNFATIQDLAARSGMARISEATDDQIESMKLVELPVDSTPLSSLPKRRSA